MLNTQDNRVHARNSAGSAANANLDLGPRISAYTGSRVDVMTNLTAHDQRPTSKYMKSIRNTAPKIVALA